MSNKPPDDQDNLLELLKKVWLPVAGFMGAVTLAYNFYKLWQGDQEGFTYFLAGGGLFVLTTALVWVGFRRKIITVRSERPFVPTRTEKIPAYPMNARRAAWVGLVIIFLGMLWFGYAGLQRARGQQLEAQLLATAQAQATQTAQWLQQAQATQHIQSTEQVIQARQAATSQAAQSTQQARETMEEQLIVVITAFDGPEDVYGMRNQIFESLRADFAGDNRVKIVGIDTIVNPADGGVYARRLGETNFADIVIWGWYRPTENPNMNIHIENLALTQLATVQESSHLQPVTTLAELESFAFQYKAGQETSALISALAGFLEYQASHYDNALTRFDQSLERLLDAEQILVKQTDIYFYRGNTLIYLGRAAEAIEDYGTVIQIDSGYVTAYTNRGVAHAQLGELQLALKDYDEAIKLNAQDSTAFTNRGAVYFHMGDHQRAFEDFQRALQINPQDAYALNNRGVIYAESGESQLAFADFDMALEVNPQLGQIYHSRGNLFDALGEPERALEEYGKALEIDPQDAVSYYDRGVTYAGMGEYQKAREDFDRAIQFKPDYEKAYVNRGNMHDELGDSESALKDYEKAIQLDPDDALAYYNRGFVYFRMQQYEDALRDFNTTLEKDPNYANAYYWRGKTYEALGNTVAAEPDFKKYEELTGQKP